MSETRGPEAGTESRPTLAERIAEPSTRQLRWLPQLDGFRGIGTVAVISAHFCGQYDQFVRSFSVAVDIFFALSGFLITTILFDELQRRGSISLRKFYIRRAVRLFPALYAFLAVFVVFVMVAGGTSRGELLGEVAAAFFYIYNFFVAWVGIEGNALLQLWTLSIEQQFYLLWPLIFVPVFVRSTKRGVRSTRFNILLLVMIAFVVALPILRMTLYQHLGHVVGPDGDMLGMRNTESFLFGLSIMRPDSVVLGCLAAIALRLEPEPPSPRRARFMSLAGDAALGIIILSILLGGFEPFQRYVSPLGNLAIAASAMMMLDLVRNPDKPVARALRAKPFVWLGQRSYGIYIWHLVVFFLIHGAVEGLIPGRSRLVIVVTFPFAFAASIGLGAASWRFVEQPAMRLKKRFGT